MKEVTNREEKISEVQNEIEQNLKVIGSTGIEDQLGDRVPETIASLKEAGIKIWMLTGDMKDTAINVGHSCGLIDKDYKIVSLDVSSK